MNDIQLFNQPVTSNRIPLSTLVEHILFRDAQTNAGLENFTLERVTEWFTEVNWGQYYTGQELFNTDEGVTEVACVALSNTLVNPDLRRLVQYDILSLFGGFNNGLQMLHSSYDMSTDLSPTGSFGDLKLEPEGCDPFYFPNGTRGVSSKYLEAVSQELFNQGMLGDKKPRRHDHLLTKVKEFVKSLSSQNFGSLNLNHSYYDMIEDTYYFDVKNPNSKHIWMSKDLCLAIAATEHKCIQVQVINDLNRLQNLIQMYTGQTLPQPSLQGYLPGTLEEQYREKGLTEISTGRALGYYPMAQVKQMFCDQNSVDLAAFDAKYPWTSIYNDLYALSNHLNQRTLDTESHTGQGVTKLFHISVLKEYFKDIDFSTLEE